MLKGGWRMYKLLAIDIDGTLINRDGKIHSKTYRAIANAKAQGKIVTLSTGRNYYSALRYAKELNITAPIITANGSLIKDIQTGEVKIVNNFSHRKFSQIIDTLNKERNLFLQAYHLDGVISFGRNNILKLAKILSGKNKFPFKETVALLTDFKQSKTKIQSLTSDNKTPIHKFFVVGPKSQCKYLERKLQNVECRVEHHFMGDAGYLEIIPLESSKGEALSWLANYYNVSLQHTLAIGDSANDISMFKKAGLAVAMANATAEAKENANHITLSNDNNGVAWQ